MTGNNSLQALIKEGIPFAAGKIGAGEGRALVNYLNYTLNEISPVQWNAHPHMELYEIAGVFPPSPEMFDRFCELYLNYIKDIDLIEAWQHPLEEFLITHTCPSAIRCAARSIEPWHHDTPWTASLRDKKILAISPFGDTIEKQTQPNRHYYSREAARKRIWPRKNILWECDVSVLKVPFCASVQPSAFASWDQGLKIISDEISKLDFDVALIGAGAWSLPLAVFCKKIGKIGIHTGGGTQLFFGIKGRRWDNHPLISPHYNPNWTRPLEHETPPLKDIVEEGCYW
jgi:hypothetical protein